MKKSRLENIDVNNLVILKRNPQYLTPKQMESLKKSIRRDGFCVPILVRPIRDGGKKYEIVSGNHRFMAANELGMPAVPCVVINMDNQSAKRLAVNLNTIHGEPSVELLAPFLADMDMKTLGEIHIENELKNELLKFDENMAAVLKKLEVPDEFNHKSPTHKNVVCICPACGRKHFKM